MKPVCSLACLAAAGCLSGVGAETPLEVIAARDTAFADLYNKGDYAGVTAVYHPDADLVPDTVDEFLTHDKLENFFEDSARQGLADLKLEPLNVVVESDTLWHEIGNVSHSLNPGGNLYYVRWVKPNSTWLIAFDMMTIGEGFKQTVQLPKTSRRQQHGVAKGDDNQVIAALEGLWTALYDAGDYAGVRSEHIFAVLRSSTQRWHELVWPVVKTTSVAMFLHLATYTAPGRRPVQPWCPAYPSQSLHRVSHPGQVCGVCVCGCMVHLLTLSTRARSTP